MEALKVNKFGRTYRTGIALDQDMRSLIIDRILHEGGDRVTGFIPRSFCYFSEELKLSVNTITKIWRNFYEELSIKPCAKGGRSVNGYCSQSAQAQIAIRSLHQKKITKIARERFTHYLAAKDPRRIKFFDEAGVKLPDIGARLYGHSSTGTRCVEVVKKAESPNTTLNMLVSLDGPEYFLIYSRL